MSEGFNDRVVVRTSVAWGDCDPAGVVFYPTIFSWMDRAAHAMFSRVGVATHRPGVSSMFFPVVEAGAQFLSPVVPDDEVDIRVRVTGVGTSSVRFEHEAVLHGTERVVARGWEQRVQVVSESNGVFTSEPLDPELRAALEARMETTSPVASASPERAIAAE